MIDLHRILRDYLGVRRALGYKLDRAGRLLPGFVTFLDESSAAFITTQLALTWATQAGRGGPPWFATRLGLVRPFAKYVSALDPRTEIPSVDLLPGRRRRGTPYVYSEEDVQALLTAARSLRSPFIASTYTTLLGLLACTGMRVGEVLALDRSDLDPRHGLLLVRHSKFGKSRLVPLEVTTLRALTKYGRERDRTIRPAKSPSLLVSSVGSRLDYRGVHHVFLRLLKSADLADRRPRRPRIHDLRHGFAVTTLLNWYRAGVDVQSRLPLLSTYLGHVSPSSTYWYLTATPQLIMLAHQRLERALGGRS
ncbi:MAG: tyrosine-type recombinase/integrase [Deltaproteobacteria bacterium]|nr:tyrosine-type recombinase/integrase [Deltaproteobacteria bacterium]